MRREQMKRAYNDIQNVEYLLGRELKDDEVEYISKYGDRSFLDNIFGGNGYNFPKAESDYYKLRQLIAELCTSKEDCYTEVPTGMFFDNNEYNDSDLFNYDDGYEKREEIISDLKTMVEQYYQKLQAKRTKEYNEAKIKEDQDRVKKELQEEKIRKALEMLSDKKELNNFNTNIGDALEDECTQEDLPEIEEQEKKEVSLMDLIPESAAKWVNRLTEREIFDVYNDLHYELGNPANEEERDEFIGEFVDRLKNKTLQDYFHILTEEPEVEINDDEIVSELKEYVKSKDRDLGTIRTETGVRCRLIPVVKKECRVKPNIEAQTEVSTIEKALDHLIDGDEVDMNAKDFWELSK